MMISRLVMNLRKVNEQETNGPELMTGATVLFAPNPELPVRTQTRVSGLYPSEMAPLSDIR